MQSTVMTQMKLFGMAKGNWSTEEQLRYLLFIEKHHAKVEHRETRRLWRIFKKMSEFVQSRKPNQCRRYHEQMKVYFESVKNIVLFSKRIAAEHVFQTQRIRNELELVEFGVPTIHEDLPEEGADTFNPELLRKESESDSPQSPKDLSSPKIGFSSRIETSTQIFDSSVVPVGSQILPQQRISAFRPYIPVSVAPNTMSFGYYQPTLQMSSNNGLFNMQGNPVYFEHGFPMLHWNLPNFQ